MHAHEDQTAVIEIHYLRLTKSSQTICCQVINYQGLESDYIGFSVTFNRWLRAVCVCIHRKLENNQLNIPVRRVFSGISYKEPFKACVLTTIVLFYISLKKWYHPQSFHQDNIEIRELSLGRDWQPASLGQLFNEPSAENNSHIGHTFRLTQNVDSERTKITNLLTGPRKIATFRAQS